MSNIAVVRRAVTSFVENMANAIPEELTTNPNSPLHHLNTPNQRVGCARTYEVDKVHMLECFVVLFGLFVKRNVGIWINTSSDIDHPIAQLVKFDIDSSSEDRDKVVFVINQDHITGLLQFFGSGLLPLLFES